MNTPYPPGYLQRRRELLRWWRTAPFQVRVSAVWVMVKVWWAVDIARSRRLTDLKWHEVSLDNLSFILRKKLLKFLGKVVFWAVSLTIAVGTACVTGSFVAGFASWFCFILTMEMLAWTILMREGKNVWEILDILTGKDDEDE